MLARCKALSIEWPWLGMRLGINEPMTMPKIDAKRPNKLAGTKVSVPSKLRANQVPTPKTTDIKAPCVLALGQNAPATKGTKAPVKVTL